MIGVLLACKFFHWLIREQIAEFWRSFLFPPADRANAGEDGVVEGILTRKHEWESTTKKASNRSWDKVRWNRVLIKWMDLNKIYLFLLSDLLCFEAGPCCILQGPEDGEDHTRTDMARWARLRAVRCQCRSSHGLHKEEACVQDKVSERALNFDTFGL